MAYLVGLLGLQDHHLYAREKGKWCHSCSHHHSSCSKLTSAPSLGSRSSCTIIYFISRYSEGHKLHTEVLVRMTHAPLDYRASAPVPCKGKQRAPNQTARSTSTTGYASGSHSIDRSMTLPLPSRIPPTPTRIKQAKRNEIVETGADADADAGGGPGAGRKQLHVWRGGPPLRWWS